MGREGGAEDIESRIQTPKSSLPPPFHYFYGGTRFLIILEHMVLSLNSRIQIPESRLFLARTNKLHFTLR